MVVAWWWHDGGMAETARFTQDLATAAPPLTEYTAEPQQTPKY